MKYKLEYNFNLRKREAVIFTSDWMDAALSIDIGKEIERKNIGKNCIFYDENGTTWRLKELIKLTEEMEQEPHDFTIYFDGGFRIEDQLTGIGVVLLYHQGKKKYRIRANELIHELTSNNEAEYAALYFALRLLEELEVKGVTCEIKGDSQVVLNQLTGEWPCYEEELNRWLDRIEEKIKQLKLHTVYSPIGRNENKEADKLATQAIEGKKIYSKMHLV